MQIQTENISFLQVKTVICWFLETKVYCRCGHFLVQSFFETVHYVMSGENSHQ
jgi:hypothetical protein